MDYPLDGELEPDTRALLAAFRVSLRSKDPDPRMMGLMRDDMPLDLRAWLHTYAHHSTLVCVGDLWLERRNAKRLGDVIDAFQARDNPRLVRNGVEGLALDDAIILGNTADGEVFYAAAWKPGDRVSTLVRFCFAGYNDDGYRALGGLVDGLRSIADNIEDVNDLDEPVRAVLAGDREG
ncbi:MAG: hypothetical protein JNL83_30680 [Myxococcales bacterium]|nr:hypothetical protein [Myxococcales bacterium]